MKNILLVLGLIVLVGCETTSQSISSINDDKKTDIQSQSSQMKDDQYKSDHRIKFLDDGQIDTSEWTTYRSEEFRFEVEIPPFMINTYDGSNPDRPGVFTFRSDEQRAAQAQDAIALQGMTVTADILKGTDGPVLYNPWSDLDFSTEPFIVIGESLDGLVGFSNGFNEGVESYENMLRGCGGITLDFPDGYFLEIGLTGCPEDKNIAFIENRGLVYAIMNSFTYWDAQ